MKIAVLIATFNRVETTIKCLENLHKSKLSDSTFVVYLVDGGSEDNTAIRVQHDFPETKVSVVPGVYWNGGMLEAWKMSLQSQDNYDAFLWLNDDVHMHSNAFQEIINNFEEMGRNSIVVGYTRSPITHEVTYGALKNFSKSKINFQVTVNNSDNICSMNGNCVLVPKVVQEMIGLLNPKFKHSFGDIDYGLRAARAGILIKSTKNSVANLERNISIYSSNSKQTLFGIIRIMRSPKGIPIKEWFYFTKTHAGALWPINFILRYQKLLR